VRVMIVLIKQRRKLHFVILMKVLEHMYLHRNKRKKIALVEFSAWRFCRDSRKKTDKAM